MAYKLLDYDEMYGDKADIGLALKVVMRGRRETREFELIGEQTRTLCRHEVHEFILTDEEGQGPGGIVNRCAYIGFAEVLDGGLIAVGDRLEAGGLLIGTVVGFDYNHMPNHMNIVLHSENMRTGEELGFRPGQSMVLTR